MPIYEVLLSRLNVWLYNSYIIASWPIIVSAKFETAESGTANASALFRADKIWTYLNLKNVRNKT